MASTSGSVFTGPEAQQSDRLLDPVVHGVISVQPLLVHEGPWGLVCELLSGMPSLGAGTMQSLIPCLPSSRNAPLAITGTSKVSSWADVSPVSAMVIQTAAFLALAPVW